MQQAVESRLKVAGCEVEVSTTADLSRYAATGAAMYPSCAECSLDCRDRKNEWQTTTIALK